MSNRVRIKHLLPISLHLWCLLGLLTEYPYISNVFLSPWCFYAVAFHLAQKCWDGVAGLQQSVLSVTTGRLAGSPQDASTAALPKRVLRACLSSSCYPSAYRASEWLRPQSFVHFLPVEEGRRSCLEQPWTAAPCLGGTGVLPTVPTVIPRLQLSGQDGTHHLMKLVPGQQTCDSETSCWIKLLRKLCMCGQFYLPFSIWDIHKCPSAGFFLLNHKVKLSLKWLRILRRNSVSVVCIFFSFAHPLYLFEEHRPLKARVLNEGHVHSSIVSL